MNTGFSPQGNWTQWTRLVAGSAKDGNGKTHTEIDGGEICIPVYHPHRDVRSVRPRSVLPWQLTAVVQDAAEVMPALEGGAEALLCVGCRDAGPWLEGVIRDFVDLEFVATNNLTSDQMPVKGGWTVPGWNAEQVAQHAARLAQADGSGLRAVRVSDADLDGWSTAARLALLCRGVEQAESAMQGQMQRVAVSLTMDADPILALASAEALKPMLVAR